MRLKQNAVDVMGEMAWPYRTKGRWYVGVNFHRPHIGTDFTFTVGIETVAKMLYEEYV